MCVCVCVCVCVKGIKGHAGHPQNEKCDQLAVAAAESTQLSVDIEYESVSKMD